MKDDGFLLVKCHGLNRRPQGIRSFAAATKHNKRTLSDPGDGKIDHSLSRLNQSLFGLPNTPDEVIALANKLMKERGYKPKRADSVIATECVFSLCDKNPGFDPVQYFSDCAKWAENNFCGVLLSADIHRDQEHLHCHAIILLPLENDGPSGSTHLGDKTKTNERNEDFFRKVASRYGLRKPDPKLSTDDRRILSKQVHDYLVKTNDPVMNSPMWPSISNDINRDPLKYMRELGMPVPARVLPTVRQLAQSTGKGKKTAAAQASSDRQLQRRAESVSQTTTDTTATPIGVQNDPAIDQHLPCVGVHQKQSVPGASQADSVGTVKPASDAIQMGRFLLHPAIPHIEITRERDSTRAASDWDSETGEFIQRPPVSPQYLKADAIALAALLRPRGSGATQ